MKARYRLVILNFEGLDQRANGQTSRTLDSRMTYLETTDKAAYKLIYKKTDYTRANSLGVATTAWLLKRARVRRLQEAQQHNQQSRVVIEDNGRGSIIRQAGQRTGQRRLRDPVSAIIHRTAQHQQKGD